MLQPLHAAAPRHQRNTKILVMHYTERLAGTKKGTHWWHGMPTNPSLFLGRGGNKRRREGQKACVTLEF